MIWYDMHYCCSEMKPNASLSGGRGMEWNGMGAVEDNVLLCAIILRHEVQ